MSSRIAVPPKLVAEQPSVVVDFASVLGGSGATLVSAVTVASVFYGVDGSPQSIVHSTAVTALTTLVTVSLWAGTAGVIYDCEVRATDTNGNIWSICFYLTVTGPAP